MFLGVAKDDDGIERIFLENNTEAIVLSLESGFDVDYFLINIVGKIVTLKPVTLKAGPRVRGRVLEVAEITADGKIVGNAEVEKP